jgi:DNA invertase Pin-like site-specific DNA recombinase
MSTEHQQYSPQNQLDVIRQYAAEHNMDIVQAYSDHGRSGLDRPLYD